MFKNKCKYHNNSTPLYISRYNFFIVFLFTVGSLTNVLDNQPLFSLFAFLFVVLFIFFSFSIFFGTKKVNYENEVHPYTYSRTYF